MSDNKNKLPSWQHVIDMACDANGLKHDIDFDDETMDKILADYDPDDFKSKTAKRVEIVETIPWDEKHKAKIAEEDKEAAEFLLSLRNQSIPGDIDALLKKRPSKLVKRERSTYNNWVTLNQLGDKKDPIDVEDVDMKAIDILQNEISATTHPRVSDLESWQHMEYVIEDIVGPWSDWPSNMLEYMGLEAAKTAPRRDQRFKITLFLLANVVDPELIDQWFVKKWPELNTRKFAKDQLDTIRGWKSGNKTWTSWNVADKMIV